MNIDAEGYPYTGKHERVHVAVATRALGKPLPSKAHVHHVNLDPGDYWTRALDATGSADSLKCCYCPGWILPEVQTKGEAEAVSAEQDREIDLAFPKFKDITCLFCGSHVRLIRRGLIGALSGRFEFYYVEKGWVDDWRNHECVWKINLPASVKADAKKEKPRPVYGPHRVPWWIPYGPNSEHPRGRRRPKPVVVSQVIPAPEPEQQNPGPQIGETLSLFAEPTDL